jgi:hypothetical protein
MDFCQFFFSCMLCSFPAVFLSRLNRSQVFISILLFSVASVHDLRNITYPSMYHSTLTLRKHHTALHTSDPSPALLFPHLQTPFNLPHPCLTIRRHGASKGAMEIFRLRHEPTSRMHSTQHAACHVVGAPTQRTPLAQPCFIPRVSRACS